MTLDDFETLVLSQQPANRPWQPVTDFSFEARKQVEGEHPRLIKETFGLSATDVVVDAGCGPDGHLVRLLSDIGVRVLGFDPQIRNKSTAKMLMHGSVTETQQDDAPPFARLVICREVLEHLTVKEIRKAVTNLCKLSLQFVYVTTRFAKNPQSLLDVDTSDELDPTHITMLNQDFLRVLFVLEGFKRRADLEEKLDWRHFGRVLVYERV